MLRQITHASPTKTVLTTLAGSPEFQLQDQASMRTTKDVAKDKMDPDEEDTDTAANTAKHATQLSPPSAPANSASDVVGSALSGWLGTFETRFHNKPGSSLSNKLRDLLENELPLAKASVAVDRAYQQQQKVVVGVNLKGLLQRGPCFDIVCTGSTSGPAAQVPVMDDEKQLDDGIKRVRTHLDQATETESQLQKRCDDLDKQWSELCLREANLRRSLAMQTPTGAILDTANEEGGEQEGQDTQAITISRLGNDLRAMEEILQTAHSWRAEKKQASDALTAAKDMTKGLRKHWGEIVGLQSRLSRLNTGLEELERMQRGFEQLDGLSHVL